jgi:hypothetical protein
VQHTLFSRYGLRILGCFAVAWLAVVFPAFSQDAPPAMKTVVPTEIDSPLPNPYMGWGTWAGRRQFGYNEKSFSVQDDTTGFGDETPLFNWVLVDWDWASLEPVEGQFNWKDFDAALSYWSARDKQFVVRFWVTDDAGWNGHPGSPVLPDWLWKKGVKYKEYVGNGSVKQKELVYADPSYEKIYLPALKKFLAAFAEKYDKPGTPVILLQVMGYGHWADWACWYSHYKFPSREFKHQLLSKIMMTYVDTFKHIQLFEFSGPDWDGNLDRTLQDRLYSKALDVAIDHGFALIWTGFIDGLRGWDRDLMEKYWREHPIIAEGNWSFDDMKDQRIHGTVAENLDVALEWHANFEHFYTGSDAYPRALREDRASWERGLESGGLGYRLLPTELSWPEATPAGNLFVLRQKWVNRNVGRLYVKHPIKIYFVDSENKVKFSEDDSSFDETSWVQGETHSLLSVFHLPKDLAPGTYQVRLALVDEKGIPRIALPIQGDDGSKRYNVGEVTIVAPEGKAPCDKAFCP